MSKIKDTLLEPIIANNPVALQILGICSALAVTSSMKVAFVMCLALTTVAGILQLVCFDYSQPYPQQHPYYCADDYYCLTGNCGGSGAQGRGLRYQQAAVSICWPDYYQLYCDGSR